MGRATKSQIIWRREGSEHDDLRLDLPNIINTDIGFQLMFGVTTNFFYDEELEKRHHENFSVDVYKHTKEELKNYFK